MNYFWQHMNYLDIIIIIPLVWGSINGFRRGFIVEVASLVALIAGIYGAMEFSFLTANWLNENLEWSQNAVQMTAFVLTFIAIVLLVRLIAKLIQKLAKLAALGIVDKFFGAVFGTLKFLLIVSGILYILNAVDSRYPFIDSELRESSIFYEPASSLIPFIYPRIEKEMTEQRQSYIA